MANILLQAEPKHDEKLAEKKRTAFLINRELRALADSDVLRAEIKTLVRHWASSGPATPINGNGNTDYRETKRAVDLPRVMVGKSFYITPNYEVKE